MRLNLVASTVLPPAAIPRPESLTPDAAVLVGTAGICLGLLEFNRPGRILPGALGLLLFLFASAAFLDRGIRPSAAMILLLVVAIFVANAWRRVPVWALAAATLALIAALRLLSPPTAPVRVHTPVAILAGTVLGSLTGILTRIAYRARRSKALD